MKKIIYTLLILIAVMAVSSCLSAPAPVPTVLENVSWEELANKDLMEANGNRYVTFETQFLGTDAKAIPFQALYSQISGVILMNHTEKGNSYDEKVISSLDSFLIGLPMTDEANNLMTESKFGDTVKITGRTEYVNAGFGMFKHLLVKVESFENLGQ